MRLEIKYAPNPNLPSRKIKFLQETLPKNDILKAILDKAKSNQEKRIKLRENPPVLRIIHTEYIKHKIKPVVIHHNYDHYKLVESLRTTSVEKAQAILNKRNKNNIVSAILFSDKNATTVLI